MKQIVKTVPSLAETQALGATFPLERGHLRILLEAFPKHGLLTTFQVTRLLYSVTSQTKVETLLLTLLADYGYIRRFKLPTAEGRRPFIYTWDEAGLAYMVKNGVAENELFYIPRGDEERNYLRIMHWLELNDFLILAKLLEKARPDTSLFDLRHDMVLKHKPVKTHTFTLKNHMITAVADAYIEFKVKETLEKDAKYSGWVELDRNTVGEAKFVEKLKKLVRIYDIGEHNNHFGSKKIHFLFVTTGGPKRVERMRFLARKVLKGVDAKDWKNRMFLFTAVPSLEDQVALFSEGLVLNKRKKVIMKPVNFAYQVFCGKSWYHPYGDNTPVAWISSAFSSTNARVPVQ